MNLKQKLSILFLVFIVQYFFFAPSFALKPTQHSSTDLQYTTALALNPDSNGELFAGSKTAGLFKTTNNGQTWNAIAPNIFAANYIFQIIYHPIDHNEIYVCSNKGVYKTNDGGKIWNKMNDIFGYAITFNPLNSNELYLVSRNKLYHSLNDGQDWSERSFAYTLDMAFELVINRINPNIMLFPTMGPEPGTHLYKSVDGAQNWDIVSNQFIEKILADPINPNAFYGLGNKVLKTEDNGDHWQSIFVAKDPHDLISSGYIDQFNPLNIILVVANEGIFKTIDGGKTWNLLSDVINKNTNNRIQLIVNPHNSQEMFVGLDDGVYRSDDGGKTWTQTN